MSTVDNKIREGVERQIEEASSYPDKTFQAFIQTYPKVGDGKYHLNIVDPSPKSYIANLIRKLGRVSPKTLSSPYVTMHKVGVVKGRDAKRLAELVEGREVSRGLDDLPDFFIEVEDSQNGKHSV